MRKALNAVLLVLLILAAAGPAVAQQAAAPPPAGTQAASGPTLQLSMQQAVDMALETNLGLKASRLDTNIASTAIASARAAFRPLFQSSISKQASESQSASFFESTGSVVNSSYTNVRSTLQQRLPWHGATYDVSWTNNRSTTTRFGQTFNPQLSSSTSFNFSQPVLQGFRIDSFRAQLQASERNRQIADLTLEESITGTRSSVQLAYLSLIGAIEQLKVANQNMDLAQESLRNFRRRVAVGVSADIEVIQSEAEVASREEQVVVAEAGISAAEDALRALILDPKRPDYWQVGLRPTDTIEALPKNVDVEAVIRNALANRLDLQAARRQQENTSLNVRLSEDQVKPALNFNLSYAAAGTGGTHINFDQSSFPPVELSREIRGFSSVVGDAFGGANPTWVVGATFAYPLGLSQAKAAVTRARLSKEQEDIRLQNLELQITTQVRGAVRDVQTNLKRVEVTRRALEATQRQLDAEQRKHSVGLSSAFELQSRQRDLANARIVELGAMIAYNRALIALERVQKIPTGF